MPTTITASMQEPSTTDPIRTYLKEIGRTPLLTHEEEVSLGKQVQAMAKLREQRQAIVSEWGREPTQEEWAEQAGLAVPQLNSILLREERARQRMIQANLRLAVSIAKKYPNRGMELLDLVQEGSIGLARAVEKFDPSKGYRFSTYAYHWIRQAITRAIAEKSRTIRLPVHATEKNNKIKKTQRLLSQQLGRTPRLSEVAEATEVPQEQIQKLQEIKKQPISLDRLVGEKQDTTLGELLQDPGLLPEEQAEQHERLVLLHKLLAELTPQQQEALSLRFGLGDGNPLTLAKAGECMGVSRERARQLEAAALKQLRAICRRGY